MLRRDGLQATSGKRRLEAAGCALSSERTEGGGIESGAGVANGRDEPFGALAVPAELRGSQDDFAAIEKAGRSVQRVG